MKSSLQINEILTKLNINQQTQQKIISLLILDFRQMYLFYKPYQLIRKCVDWRSKAFQNYSDVVVDKIRDYAVYFEISQNKPACRWYTFRSVRKKCQNMFFSVQLMQQHGTYENPGPEEGHVEALQMVSKSDDMICWDAKYFILDVQIEFTAIFK